MSSFHCTIPMLEMDNNQIKRIETLNGLINEEPNEPFHPYALGLEYRNEEPDKALDLWFDLMNRFSSYLPVYYPLAELLGELGRFEAAIDVCVKGMELAQLQGNLKTYNELKSNKTNLEMEI